MKTRYLLILMLLFGSINLLSQGKLTDTEIREKLLREHAHNSSSQGRNFILAAPQDYEKNYAFNAFEAYVTSSYHTRACIRTNEGTEVCKQVYPNQITTFSNLNNGEMNVGWEIWDAEVVQNKGFYLEAEKPVSVYILMAKPYTSEGYMGIPVGAWGKRYHAFTYKDLNFFGTGYPGGFCVVASEQNTKVTIRILGESDGKAKTSGTNGNNGKKIGETIKITMNKGDTYMVRGDGTSPWLDLSGSEITANKPIGVIGFHTCVFLPTQVSYCDNLLAFLPPVETWGKQYATVELQRQRDRGDFFKIIASENNTNCSVSWYTLGTAKLIGNREFTLNSGDYFDYLEISPTSGCTGTYASIRGMSVFNSDKPVMVMQYSYSSLWDCITIGLDPFMFTVTPVEQYTKQTTFQTPSNSDFMLNYFNIVALGDSSDTQRSMALLKSITLDGVAFWTKDPAFILNRIPATNIYWGRTTVPVGPHNLKGETPFGGYIYGYSSYDSYGWPAATNFSRIGETDTLPPILATTDLGCGVYKVNVLETRNGAEGDDPMQIDRGIDFDPMIIEEESYNFEKVELLDEITNEPVDKWTGFPVLYNSNWRFRVKDKNKDAFIKYVYFDASERQNSTIDSIRYIADKFTTNLTEVKFPDTRVNTNSAVIPFEIISDVDRQLTITKVYLEKKAEFSILKGAIGTPVILNEKGDKHTVELQYKPTKEYPDVADLFDWDSLVVETSCALLKFPIEGRGIEPRINVTDCPFGTLNPGTEEKYNLGIKITNSGTMDLTITGIRTIKDKDGVDILIPNTPTSDINLVNTTIGDFEIRNLAPAFPFVVPAKNGTQNGEVVLNEVWFKPDAPGVYRYTIEFDHNAQDNNTKDICIMTGDSKISNVKISKLEWAPKRVGSENRNNSNDAFDSQNNLIPNKGYILIENKGSQAATIKSLAFNSKTADFDFDATRKILSTGDVDFPQASINGANLGVSSYFKVPVIFKPTQEGQIATNTLDLTYTDGTEEVTLTTTLDGAGFEPKLEYNSIVFANKTKVGETSTEEHSFVLRNTSSSQKLTVHSIKWVGEENLFVYTDENNNIVKETVFEVQPPLPNGAFPAGPFEIEPGDTKEFLVKFTPRQSPMSIARYEIISDAGRANPGDDEDLLPKDYQRISGDSTARGSGYTTGSSIARTIAPDVMKCDASTGTITVTNDSDSDPMTISQVSITKNAGIFTLVDGAGNPLPANFTTIVPPAPNGNYVFTYKFDASLAPSEGVIDGTVEVVTSDGILTTDIGGGSRKGEVRLDLKTITTPQTPGQFMPGTNAIGAKNVNFPVNITCSGDRWDDAKIKYIEFEMEYPFSAIDGSVVEKLNPISPEYDYVLPADWTITQEEIPSLDSKKKRLKIIAQSTTGTHLNRGGLLCNPGILLLLPESLTFDVTLDNNIITDRAGCVTTAKTDGAISLNTCAPTLRGITTDVTSYSFGQINPNPISGTSFELDYSIGLDGDTKIEIVNTQGDIVAVPVNSAMKRGGYKQVIPTNDLSSGAYLIRITSGPYMEAQELIIAK